MDKGDLYVYKEFINGKLLNCYQVEFIETYDEIHRFKAHSSSCDHHHNVFKDAFPINVWRTDQDIVRKTEYTKT